MRKVIVSVFILLCSCGISPTLTPEPPTSMPTATLAVTSPPPLPSPTYLPTLVPTSTQTPLPTSTETIATLTLDDIRNTDDPICCNLNGLSPSHLELVERARSSLLVFPYASQLERKLADWKALYRCEDISAPCYIYVTEPLGFGDVNGDGLEDLTFILVDFSGGNWISYLIASVLRRENGFEVTPMTYIGGRIKFQGFEIQDGTVTVKLDMFEFQNWDQPCWKDGNGQISYQLEAVEFVCQPVREIPPLP